MPLGTLLNAVSPWQVTLRAGAELNAHWVSLYNLTLRATCPGEDKVEKQLFVWVKEGQVLHCDALFTSAGRSQGYGVAGATGLILISIPLPTPVPTPSPHSCVCPPPFSHFCPCSCPHYYPYPHSYPCLNPHPWCHLGPSHSHPGTTPQTFRLEIEVMDNKGHNCSGAVRVEVLPSEPQKAVMVPGVIGPLEVVTQVHASGDNVRYAILAPIAPTFFTINERTGNIHSTHRLEVAQEQLLVLAYNELNPADSWAKGMLCHTHNMGPELSCWLHHCRSQVSETALPGTTLVTLRCTGCKGAEGCLHYLCRALELCLIPLALAWQVSTTLDYDSKAVATLGFQFTATIVVTAEGQPPRSTRVPVLVTVTPVNEFTPVCPNDTTFTVPETAAFGSAVGLIAGTDRDYPPDSLEYSLEGGPGPDSCCPAGEIRVVGPLDSRQHRSYRLTVRLTDTHNDLDPAKRRSCLCTVTVHVQAVLDQAPVCTPEVQELWITARSGSRQPVTRLACQGSRDGATLTYSIAGGNEDGRFQLEGNSVLYLPNNLPEPRTFVLLVEVWAGSGTPRHSTAVALVVHVTPRSTPVPPSTTTQPHPQTPLKEHLVITRMEAVWHPPAWFMAVLTVSGALLLAALGCMARSLLYQGLTEGPSTFSPISTPQEQFDGRAQDPRTGRDYLFNSKTGARRWI
uniref:Uncharacterized protein n=1 Tax=Melopsittacus undulatus TaxID=13146 RepID=A0A8C6N6A9_MELUD